MTEIPEHLLKRAAERRAAMTGGGDAAGAAPAGDAPAADAGAPAPTAAVAKKEKAQAPLPTLDSEPTPAKPDIAVVAAAKHRKRVPFWAAPILALLPLWAFIYVYAVQPPPAGENDPLVIGKAVYTLNCAGCHGATGEGVKAGLPGQQLDDGHVLKTFKDPLAMAHWVAFGAADGARPDGTYGDKDRPGGAMNTAILPGGVMPAFGTKLSPEELAAVVIYVRDEISGNDPTADKSFNVETFTADPTAVAAQITAVIAAGPGGDPDLTAAQPAG